MAFALLLGLLWMPLGAEAAEERFQDDFNRADGKEVGNGWNLTPNFNECPPPRGVKSGKVPTPSDKNAPFEEISREIEKKTGKKGSKKSEERQEPSAAEPFHGATARIRDGMLFFQYAENQDAQMAQREFNQPLVRLTYDFTPLYAMGGLDDRAWIGVRIFFLDAAEMILGEIRHFYYQSDFPERSGSDSVHVIVQKGSFDGTARHAEIDVQKILEQRLRGVDKKKIVKTRLSLEAATGVCSSSVEAYMDNVVATLGAGAPPFRLTREMLLDMAELGMERFARERSGFPGNWKNAIFDKYGRQALQGWLNELPTEARTDALRLTDYLAQRHALTGRDAWLISHAVQLLLQSP
ncbi:MAG: hypothetical protein G8237_03615 [Magnetococcales bacterium]|nr:hypothetical protein [Magnetococcales bacterium]